MLIIPDDKISKYLEYKKLIEALREIFQSDYTMPIRHHHFYKTSEGDDNTLILMPVWNDEYMGMKQVTVAPANANRNKPSIFAQYILSDFKTGEPLAMMNATELTCPKNGLHLRTCFFLPMQRRCRKSTDRRRRICGSAFGSGS
jgi:ornithine cyclodeaminase